MNSINQNQGQEDESSNNVEGYEISTPGYWDDYSIDELSIRDERRTTQDLVRRIDKGRFVLDPDFERGFVWDINKQSRLIESILMRIPLPVFYVAEDMEGRLIVVDGRQRLTTLWRFLKGELKLDLKDRPELNQKTFSELEIRLQNRVEDCQLHFYIIDPAVPERARLDIFERVNGGEVLSRQQMRNAIYNGPATQFLREEAATSLFVTATGNSLKQKTMQDREFVNRFSAFALMPLSKYRGDMDDWLAQGLLKLASLLPVERETLSQRFQLGLKNNYSVFSEHAFRKHKSPQQKRGIFNASLYDVMMSELSRRDNVAVEANAEKIRQAFYRLMEDERFIKAITYGPHKPKEVLMRFEIAEDMMQEVFDA